SAASAKPEAGGAASLGAQRQRLIDTRRRVTAGGSLSGSVPNRVVRPGTWGPIPAAAALSWVERVNRPAPEVPMQAPQTTHLLRQVRCWLAVQALDALADSDLLERFRRERNEAAFAVLLERHGPLVLRVCGRLLDDGHAVEDAFQATFLILARQAESI